jgi:hypothetical protein
MCGPVNSGGARPQVGLMAQRDSGVVRAGGLARLRVAEVARPGGACREGLMAGGVARGRRAGSWTHGCIGAGMRWGSGGGVGPPSVRMRDERGARVFSPTAGQPRRGGR